VLLILEGYAYLALILAIFLAATGFLVWGLLTRRPFIAMAAILVGVPVAATMGRALRAVLFSFPEPKGIAAGPHFGARLLQEVDEIAKRIGAPRVHRILISNANNASALQIPRAGVFWPTNTLILGYPLLATLSVEQMRAVIAHELGHMTHEHGRFWSWVHRTRLSWVRLMDVLERHQSVPAHVYVLFRFYVPRLHAHAVAVSRRQELLADRLAADLAGADVAAQALVAIEIGGHVLERTFWPRIFERVQHEADPPRPFAEMGPEIWEAVEDPAELLDRLLAAETAARDTHPALRDRLTALERPARLPGAAPVSAVECFFGSQTPELAAVLDREWQSRHGREWRLQHDEIRARRERLSQLAALPSPTPEETFERGALTEQEGPEDAALDLYQSAFRQGHAAGGLAAGRILLDREDATGIALIAAAMESDAALVEDGCGAIVEFLERRGRHADAHQYQVRLTRQATQARMAAAERKELTVVDRLRPCSDSVVDVAALSRRLAAEAGVLRAFVATKALRYSSGTQTVLAVLTKHGLASDLKERLCREGLLPEHVSVIVLGRHDRHLEAVLREVPGALILDTSRQATPQARRYVVRGPRSRQRGG
jgi:Zn-dependent protease with chaperone function